MTNLKIGISALVIAGTATALVVQRQTQATLREENDSLQQQITQLQSANQQLSNLVAQADSSQSVANDQQSEVLRLRNELARLRADSQELAQWKAASAQKANDPMEAAARELLGKITLLKERLREMPDKNIPELQYLPNRSWANVATHSKLETEDDVRQALSELRSLAKGDIATSISSVLHEYIRANNGQLPTNVSQLKPYFAYKNAQVPDVNPATMDAILQRYQMLKTGDASDLQPGAMLLSEKAPVDDKYDFLFEIGLTGYKSYAVSDNTTHSTSTWAPPQSPDAK